jgi:hypothetical protein
VGGATELSVCDYSAEPEMRWAEGEGVKSGFVEIPAQTVKRPLREYELGVALRTPAELTAPING